MSSGGGGPEAAFARGDRANELPSSPAPQGSQVLRAVFDGARDAMVLADDEGTWISVNPAAADLFGAPQQQLVGRNLREFAAETLADVNAAWAVFIAAGELRGRFAIRRLDGSVRQTDFSARANILPGLHLSILRDVTQMQEADAALRESRYFLEEAQAVAHIGSWVSEMADDGSLRWSDECYRIFGVPVGSALGVHSFFDRVHPDDREKVRASVARAVEQRTSYELEHRIVRPDGVLRWVFERAIVERDAQGQARRLIGVVQDITERRAVLEELRVSEQRYRRIIETTSEGAFLIDARAHVSFANERMAQLLDRPTAAILGCDFCEFVDEHHRARFQQQIATHPDHRDAPFELKLQRADRREVWVSLSVSALLDAGGRCEGWSGLATDISERKRADALSARLLAVIESCDDAIISADVQGRITSWSQGAQRIFGYPADEVMGRPIALLSPADRAYEQLELLRRVTSGEPVRNFETVRIGKHGAIPLSITLSPIRDAAGQVVGASAILRDLTEALKNQTALRQAEEQLRQVQKMEAVDRLAGGIAHDFNNLLSVILSYAGMAHDSIPGESRLREELSEIMRAGERAAELTRQLLAFSRRQVLKPEVLDLNQLLSGMENVLRRMMGEDIELHLALAAGPATIEADRGRIEQVVLNLVVNARDAMPQGGQLRLELLVPPHDAALDAPPRLGGGACVQLRVTDSGVGMDEATRARVFEPFFTTKPKGKGTGLGLSTVFGIVQQSGGHIVVSSTPGKGSTFVVSLPRSEAPVPVAKEIVAPSTLLGSETILLVEDDDQVRALARSVLLRHGYHVLSAENGAEALLVAGRHRERIALLVTDVIMPLMSGRQLADRLVAQRPELKVLFMSGYTDDALGHHGVLEAGIHFLPKPLSPAALTRKVREVLDSVPRARQRLTDHS